MRGATLALARPSRETPRKWVYYFAAGDAEGCTLDQSTHEVRTPTGFKEAYAQYVAGGWPALSCDPAFGGQGLPHIVNQCFYEMLNSANQAWTMYPGLSHGAYEALHAHGSQEQKKTYLPKLTSGEWTGTMCLTEPHCGSDLGLLKTRAEPNDDGSHAITGTKIFITAGEHDFTDNIVHLVLARLPDAPAGSRGISLFVVPRERVGRDGAIGERNAVRCGSLEHKMGIHGSATCVMIPTSRPLRLSPSTASVTVSSVSGSSVPNPSSMKMQSRSTRPAFARICSDSSSAIASDARNVSPPDSVSVLLRSPAWSRSTTRKPALESAAMR